MSDLQAHRISWLTGYTYVGNGTLGATDSVYFAAPNLTAITPASAGAGMVPVLGSDPAIGQTYVSDVEKHYSRKRVRSCKLHFIPVQPSTANSAFVYAGPVRGPGAAGDATLATGTGAAPTVPNVLGMAGSKGFASWEHSTIDLTPFIAGGSGPKQNEFAIGRDGDDASTQWGSGTMDLDMICPCAFVISGTNATAALRGTTLHMIIVEQVVDLLDFIGGAAVPFPESLAARAQREEFEKMLMLCPTAVQDLYARWQKIRK